MSQAIEKMISAAVQHAARHGTTGGPVTLRELIERIATEVRVEEREACARDCDDEAALWGDYWAHEQGRKAASKCAHRVRARGGS